MTEPPAASSGVVYQTVQQRCYACVVNGGDEDPCMPEDYMIVRERQTGRPCPFAELMPGNALAGQIVGCLINDDTRPLAGPLAEAGMEELELDASERTALLTRVRTALQNRDVVELLHPPPEKR